MAIGRPSIITSLPAIVEIMQPEFGVIIPPGDVSQLIQAMAHSLNTNYDSVVIRRFVEDHFSLPEISRRYAEVFVEAAGDLEHTGRQ